MFKNLFVAIIESKDKDLYLLLSSNFEECYIYNLSKTPKKNMIMLMYSDIDSVGEFEYKKNLENAEYLILANNDKDVFNFINKMDKKDKTNLKSIVLELKRQIIEDYQCQYNNLYNKMLKFIELYGSKTDLKNTEKLMNQNIKNYNSSL